MVFFLHAIIVFPNAAVALKQNTLTGDGLSHIVIVIVDYHDEFIKSHSQAVCICFFLVCVLSMFVKLQIYCTITGLVTMETLCRERYVYVLVLLFCNILSHSKCWLSQSYLLSHWIFLFFFFKPSSILEIAHWAISCAKTARHRASGEKKMNVFFTELTLKRFSGVTSSRLLHSGTEGKNVCGMKGETASS